jgi:hypothetical protein
LQVEAAKATVEKISSEEKDLQSTLSNIQDARPFEDLTVRCADSSNEAYSDSCSLRRSPRSPRLSPRSPRPSRP